MVKLGHRLLLDTNMKSFSETLLSELTLGYALYLMLHTIVSQNGRSTVGGYRNRSGVADMQLIKSFVGSPTALSKFLFGDILRSILSSLNLSACCLRTALHYGTST